MIHAVYGLTDDKFGLMAGIRSTKCEGQSAKDKVRRTKWEGQSTKDKVRRTKWEGQSGKDKVRRTKYEGQSTKDKVRSWITGCSLMVDGWKLDVRCQILDVRPPTTDYC